MHPTTTVLTDFYDSELRQEALQMQRDRATHFASHKYKSDLQTHSRSLVFTPFDRAYMIFY